MADVTTLIVPPTAKAHTVERIGIPDSFGDATVPLATGNDLSLLYGMSAGCLALLLAGGVALPYLLDRQAKRKVFQLPDFSLGQYESAGFTKWIERSGGAHRVDVGVLRLTKQVRRYHRVAHAHFPVYENSRPEALLRLLRTDALPKKTESADLGNIFLIAPPGARDGEDVYCFTNKLVFKPLTQVRFPLSVYITNPADHC